MHIRSHHSVLRQKKRYFILKSMISMLVFFSSYINTNTILAEGERQSENTNDSPIEVIGTPVTGRSIESTRLESIAPITGIDYKDFEREPNKKNVGDILNDLPSVNFSGVTGENRELLIRGLDKEYTRFEFGGVQLPDSGKKREFQVNRLSSFGIERITILRNPTPEYESDGIGGRVLADPRIIPDKRRIELIGKIGAGNGLDRLDFGNEFNSVSFGIGERFKNVVGYNLFLDYQKNTLERNKKTSSVSTTGLLNELSTEKKTQKIETFSVMPDFAWFYSCGELHFRPLYMRLAEDNQSTTNKFKPKNKRERENKNENKYQEMRGFSLTNTHAFSNGFSLESDIGYYISSEDKDVFAPYDKEKAVNRGVYGLDKITVQDSSVDEKFWQFRSKLVAPFKFMFDQEVRFGFAIRPRERNDRNYSVEIKPDRKVTNKSAGSDSFKLYEDYYAVFLQDTISIFKNFSITPGVRMEFVPLKSEAGNGTTSRDTSRDANPSLHALYRVTDNWSVNAAASCTVNRPALNMLSPFIDDKSTYYLQGNPSLEPAHSWNFDIGTIWAEKYHMLALNLFRKEISDVIDEANSGKSLSGKSITTYKNVGDGFTQGIELEQRFNFGFINETFSDFEFWSSQSLFNSELKRTDGYKGPFSKQADMIGNLGANYTFQPTKTTLGLIAKFIGDAKAYKVGGERQVEPHKWSMDLRAAQKITKYGELFFDAVNIFNTKNKRDTLKADGTFQQESETVGRSYFLGLKLVF